MTNKLDGGVTMCEASGITAPTAKAAGFIAHWPEFWDESACISAVEEAEQRGFQSPASHYPASYRTNARQVFDSPALAQRLFARLRGLAPAELHTDEEHGPVRWTVDSLNARFRICRYAEQEAFHVHRDGPHEPDAQHRSLLTFMVYLSAPESFEGGETQFFDDGPVPSGPPWRSLRPTRGTMILFDHGLWHAGAAVERGVKYILRSDLVYTRADAPRAGHRGYVWSLAPLSCGGHASGGRDGTIRLWDGGGRETRALLGHTQSVLGLAVGQEDHLVSVSRDLSVRQWNPITGACLQVARVPRAAPLCVAALGQGGYATGAADGLVQLWSEALAPVADLPGHTGFVWSLCSVRADRLLSAGEDGSLALWDTARRTRLWTYALLYPLRSVCRLSDQQAAVGDAAGQIHTLTVTDDGPSLLRTSGCHRGAVRALALLPGSSLASAGEDGRVLRLALADGPAAPERLGRHHDFATALLATEGALLSAGYDGVIRSVPLAAR